MAKCELCGNDYDKSFEVLIEGRTHVATHLFEESGALERVAGLASGWFTRYLSEPE